MPKLRTFLKNQGLSFGELALDLDDSGKPLVVLDKFNAGTPSPKAAAGA